MKIISLRKHSDCSQATAEHFEVIRMKHSGVFLHLPIIRIGLKLACFVRDDWDSCLITSLIKVLRRIRMEMIDHSSIVGIGKREGTTGMGIVFAPFLASDSASGEVIHSFFYSLITEIVIASKGIVLIGCNLAEIIHKLLHLVDVAPEFITQRHHSERRMMTVFSEDIFAFLMQERHQPFIFLIERTPERKLRLEIDSQAVRCHESRLRRTPGMKAHMIDSILLTGSEILHPAFHAHLLMSRQRPYCRIVLATKEYPMTIGVEVGALDMEILGEIRHLKGCRRSYRTARDCSCLHFYRRG